MSKNICQNCWLWAEPKYDQEPGTCRVDDYKIYGTAKACGDFEDRFSDEEDETSQAEGHQSTE